MMTSVLIEKRPIKETEPFYEQSLSESTRFARKGVRIRTPHPSLDNPFHLWTTHVTEAYCLEFEQHRGNDSY